MHTLLNHCIYIYNFSRHLLLNWLIATIFSPCGVLRWAFCPYGCWMAPASGVEAPIIMKLRLDSRFVPFGSTSPSIFRPDTFSRVFPLAFFFYFFLFALCFFAIASWQTVAVHQLTWLFAMLIRSTYIYIHIYMNVCLTTRRAEHEKGVKYEAGAVASTDGNGNGNGNGNAGHWLFLPFGHLAIYPSAHLHICTSTHFGPPDAASSCLPVYSPLCVRLLLALLAPGPGHSAFVCPFWPFASSTRVHFQLSVLPVASGWCYTAKNRADFKRIIWLGSWQFQIRLVFNVSSVGKVHVMNALYCEFFF